MTFTGTSFYDTLNKMLVGFLILLPWMSQYFVGNNSCSEFNLTVLIVAGWLVGIFLWAITVIIRGYSDGFLPGRHIFSKDRRLQRAYMASYNLFIGQPADSPVALPANIKNKYLESYYNVQKEGSLGNVPVLESLSEFFRNLIIVLFIWIIVIVCQSGCGSSTLIGIIAISQCPVNYGSCSCSISDMIIHMPPLCGVAICLTLILFFSIARVYTEHRINFLVFETNFYIEEIKKNMQLK